MKKRWRAKLKHLTGSEFTRILILRTIGNFLILSSIFLVGKTLYKPIFEEVRYLADHMQGKRYVVASISTQKKPGGAPVPTTQNVEVLHPKDPNFDIIIPKIAANAPVIANVNAADDKEYLQVLQKGVAHAAGSAYPGEAGHIFLFAHSTDYFWNVGTYNAVFYLLYKLEKGDEIVVFYQGKPHTYRVVTTAVVDPRQVEYMTRKTSREFLTLQTCWPLGTTLKRLLVFASPVDK